MKALLRKKAVTCGPDSTHKTGPQRHTGAFMPRTYTDAHGPQQHGGVYAPWRIVTVFLALLLALLTAVWIFGDAIPIHAESQVQLKVHYHRTDGDYSQFSSVWLWADGMDGAQYYFEEEDGEMVATMDVPDGCTSVGYIVRTENWDKDIDADQFIDLAEIVAGTVHVYIESGVEGYTSSYEEGVEIGIKLKSAVYNGDGTLTVTMTSRIEDYETAFSVSGAEGSVAVTAVTDSGDGVYLVTLEQALEDMKSYTFVYDGTEYEVSMPNIYSTEAFEAAYTYEGDDLGATWSVESTFFRVWAPTAEAMYLDLYESGTDGTDDQTDCIEMTADVNGTWVTTVEGNLNGTYYTYTVVINGEESTTVDPYARTTGVNGARAMVIDLDSTDPEGWEDDTNPHAGESITDAIIYELHVRDFSADEDSGITNVGKYLSFTETGTATSGGQITGLDYLKDLGITHVHLLPVYDFGSVDETAADGYNWGYDPVNYNVPEGSYATDPYNGEVRVSEFKQMVQSLHESGISVIMDVVYNHVQSADSFCVNVLVPGYFSRISDAGVYSNGSGCGNDTASERSMVSKYIVDSVNYWADEYHIDGFRFDLVGLLDTDTINAIVETVHETHPDVIFYGEGWDLTTTVTKENVTLATQANAALTPGFAYFNDTIRDALKGSVFSDSDIAYATGSGGYASMIASSFKSVTSWNSNPSQMINYAACHDNLTLFAKILSATSATAEFADQVKMNNLAAAVYLTAEGVPFIMSGEEMLRTKETADGSYDSNSYNSGDSVNALQYANLEDAAYQQVYQYYKGLIAFRKAHPALRMATAEDVSEYVSSLSDLDKNVVAMDIQGDMEGETADEIIVIFNPNTTSTTVTLPDGAWNIYVAGQISGTTVLAAAEGTATVEPISTMVLVREAGAEDNLGMTLAATETEDANSNGDTSEGDSADESDAVGAADDENINPVTVAVIAVAIVVIAAAVAVAVLLKKKKSTFDT
ncbi:MAG: type I pullulanase [Lachnospiraceae bacterium]|nr:type I pullulanase [Lachnospiraceae bacterium]